PQHIVDEMKAMGLFGLSIAEEYGGLGLTMVDESGLMLRQLMRQARQRIAKGGSGVRTSVSTFMELIGKNPNAFRLLLRE
ncbi:acyl-CoA dehydrogenase family protein, partial [Mycobacterium tuberculosis]|nr:acyl-CoA dehydrogenase family protein [Mycobacterium tuberculosis]